MKVVLCINDLGRGGAERQLAIIASELHKKGHKVSVLTLWGNYNYKGNIFNVPNIMKYPRSYKTLIILNHCNATNISNCFIF